MPNYQPHISLVTQKGLISAFSGRHYFVTQLIIPTEANRHICVGYVTIQTCLTLFVMQAWTVAMCAHIGSFGNWTGWNSVLRSGHEMLYVSPGMSMVDVELAVYSLYTTWQPLTRSTALALADNHCQRYRRRRWRYGPRELSGDMVTLKCIVVTVVRMVVTLVRIYILVTVVRESMCGNPCSWDNSMVVAPSCDYCIVTVFPVIIAL